MRVVRFLTILIASLLLTLPGFCSDLALIHAKVYPSPSEPPIEDGTVLVRDGRIAAVGRSADIKVPKAATIMDCKGRVVTAGFWNSHVHVLTPGLLNAEKLSAEQIQAQVQEMFTRWGFTTVFDIASVQKNTALIRRRIETGALKGPRILTVGEPFWGEGGIPIYVKAFLEENHITIPEVHSTEEATARVNQQIHDGADGVKIFANSIEEHSILTMRLDFAQAIVAAAHLAGKPVFAHVANDEGIDLALKSGVDILAHTTPADGPWSVPLVERLIAAHVALTPTLTLWVVESKRANLSAGQIEKGMAITTAQLKAFSQAGGQVLFGTDIGYITQYDTSEEVMWMSRSGMSFRQILASLTTNPAARFGYASHSGRIAKGMDADLVVLNGDPEKDVTAFSTVRDVVRNGQLIYSAQ